MEHLLNISPYRVINTNPFSSLIEIDNDSPITLVLYSSFSDNWKSMNEINKVLMKYIMVENEHINPYFLDVTDPNFEKNYELIFSSCKKIISLCTNKKVGTFIKTLKKKKDNLECFYIIFNSLKSLGFHFKHFGLDAIDTSDTFLCFCESDTKILKYLFPENKIESLSLNNLQLKKSNFPGSSNLVYFGRLNEEKNISMLLTSLHTYKNLYGGSNNFKLDLFGEIDYSGKVDYNYGNYQIYLHKLIKKLNLINEVTFHGFKTKSEISTFARVNNSIGIFLSTYHNENYSMAAREFISWGSGPVLLSNWGAHQDLIKAFKNTNRVFSIDINLYKSHPNISPFKIAKTLKHIKDSQNLDLEQVDYRAVSNRFSQEPSIKKSPIDKKIFLKQLSQDEESQSLKFNSFYAPEAKLVRFDFEKIYMHPLMEIKDQIIFFNDQEFLSFSQINRNEKEIWVEVQSFFEDKIYSIPERCLEMLFKSNLLFPAT